MMKTYAVMGKREAKFKKRGKRKFKDLTIRIPDCTMPMEQPIAMKRGKHRHEYSIEFDKENGKTVFPKLGCLVLTLPSP